MSILLSISMFSIVLLLDAMVNKSNLFSNKKNNDSFNWVFKIKPENDVMMKFTILFTT